MRKITFDIDELEAKRIEQLAKDNDRSLSAQLRMMLKHG